MSSYDITSLSTTTSTIVSNKPTNLSRARAISSSKVNPYTRDENSIVEGVPDSKTVLLKSSNVMENWENERIKILEFFGSRNDSAEYHKTFLVADFGR